MKHYNLNNWEIKKFGGGENNLLYLLNNTIIIRVSQDSSKNFSHEYDTLPLLLDLPLPIPGPVRCSEEKKIMAYPKIHGKQFDHTKFMALDKTQQHNIAENIASLFADLHPRVYHRDIAKIGLPMYDKSRIFHYELQQKTPPQKLKDRVNTLITQYTTYKNNNPIIKHIGLLHNDLYRENILVDDDYNITGIIDRGDIAIGDIHGDFIYLYHPDHDLIRMVCDRYEHKKNIRLDRNYILLCMQIFITNMHLGDTKNKDRTKQRINKRISNL